MKRALVALAIIFHLGAAQRIVSLSPNLTEILYGVGAFDQVVGVSDYCTYPPAVTKLPSVGGWTNPSLEKLAALRPDLVLLDAPQATLLQDEFAQLGLRVTIAKDQTVQDVYDSMTVLGRVTGHQQDAARLLASTRAGLLRIAQKTAGLAKPKVVLIVDRTPGTLRDLYVATGGGFLAELVEIAGGRIATPPSAIGYAKLSKEDLLAMNPDLILDFVHGAPGRLAGDTMEAWREMSELKAVRTGRVYGVDEDYVPHASQRMLQTAELFLRLIHPEVR